MDKKLPKRSIETVKYTFFSHATNRQLEKKIHKSIYSLQTLSNLTTDNFLSWSAEVVLKDTDHPTLKKKKQRKNIVYVT